MGSSLIFASQGGSHEKENSNAVEGVACTTERALAVQVDTYLLASFGEKV